MTRGKQAARDGLGLGDIAVKITTGFIETGGAADSYRFFRAGHIIQSNVNNNNVSHPGVYPGLINFTNATNPSVASGYGYIANYGRMFFRGCNTSNWGAWKESTTSAVSDATAKNISEDLDPEEALSNISRKEFRHFTFKYDESETPLRGVIYQHIETIDPAYMKKIGVRPDTNDA